jgi:hypothetical protein
MSKQELTPKFFEDFTTLTPEKQKESLAEVYKGIHSRMAAINSIDKDAVPANVLTRIEKEFGTQAIDKNKISEISKLAKKMSADEFSDFMISGELPALKLTPSEMALMNGGWGISWACCGSVCASIIGASMSGIGGVAGGAVCTIMTATKVQGGSTTGTVKKK